MKVQREVVQGRPIRVEGRTLTPVVRRTTGMWRRATVGTRQVAGQGGGFVWLRPLGVIERRGEEERFVPIPDATGRMLRGLLLAAVAVPLLLMVGVRLARR